MLVNKSKKRNTETSLSIDDKVAFLSQPAAYPFAAGAVDVKETHMSWVFLVNGFVYKMKKPVSYDLFDHRTLKSRLVNSREEIRINSFLAKDIYLGVVPLVMNAMGRPELEGKGETVEWLVKMKRIPEANMLDYAIEHCCLDEKEVRDAAVLLARYYETAPVVSVKRDEYLRKVEVDIRLTHLQLCLPLYGFTAVLLKKISEGLLAFLSDHSALLLERIKAKKIIDAHGDLRPEHICLKPVPLIIDRLEFCKALRGMDTAEELAYLSMECEMLGNRRVGELFLEEYTRCIGDVVPGSLLQFYKAKKAFTRAYLVIRHIEEDRYKNDPKWPAKAAAYLRLAEACLPEPDT